MSNNQVRVAVFGATGGIGSAVVARLVSKGYRIAAIGRNQEKLDSLCSQHDALPIFCESLNFDSASASIESACEQLGGLEGAVNCVGSLLLKPAHLTSEKEWDDIIAANLSSAFAVTRAAARRLTEQQGSIVLISSAAAQIGLANHEAIAAAKAGVIGLTLSAAATYAARGVRVNCVAPGLVRTPMTARLTENEASLKASAQMHALGRIGEPESIASAVEWLLSPEQSWVTGQVLGVDGGLGSIRSR